MKIHSMGIGFTHDESFRIDRPVGSGDNLLLIFLTSAFAVIEGKRVEVLPGSGIVFSRGTPQIYGASEKKYVNHWIHFECDENDAFFSREGFEFDRIFHVEDMGAAEKILEMLSVEILSEGNEESTDLLMKLLIIKLSTEGGKGEKSVHSAALKKLRAEIYSSASEKYTVNSLAQRLNLSPSYFQHLYRSCFGVSCYEDVLCAKTELAKYYLANTTFTVNEISRLCGFENNVHFI
ncbi:MAG: AraC family transcriptional regulator [Oscillospiraceae bacterium]|nr:AraC family transcriptional regulator [Oscillospiraceae bacterium]